MAFISQKNRVQWVRFSVFTPFKHAQKKENTQKVKDSDTPKIRLRVAFFIDRKLQKNVKCHSTKNIQLYFFSLP